MRVILSRKGFDSSCGGVPSPILEDGSLCPLPIPSTGPPCLKDVMWRGKPLSTIAQTITNGRIGPRTGVHLDPDLQASARPRTSGWRPAFGQAGAAQAHLDNRRVGIGDIFLFFGWFRRTVMLIGHRGYESAAADLHVIFGWL
jgi:hypothetical protein